MATTGELLTYNQLSEWRKDNPCILAGYRQETHSWKGCLQGLCFWHNESANTWSHLLGAIISITLLVRGLSPNNLPVFERMDVIHAYKTSKTASDDGFDSLGMWLFLLGCFVCFTCSATFHGSLCHSHSVAAVMNRVDYLGILILGTLNYFSTFHYAFFCHPHIRNLYIFLMSLSGSIGIYLVCAPKYATPSYRRMRTYTFFALGFVVIFPFIHAMFKYGPAHVSQAIALEWLIVEATAYIFGALMYAERCPEFWFPGRFDFIGSSHQIFHICSMIATWAHYISLSKSYQFWWYGAGSGSCVMF
ncbi:HlyIII-domain-containing protein [Gymnopus androsaceus JB14]|uniref:HlyIII-domain-containing protein n=1 Tax=Gymnopus androsaceus JB14 TaxID=1447944 RepID=A0A6A4GQS3_9AGAR|nr:HlyIII-domain-containing protein [Gymnopus androsaceus JB14]